MCTYSKQELKALTTANGYKYYYQDKNHVYFSAQRGDKYASIKIRQSDVMNDDQRLFMMQRDLTH